MRFYELSPYIMQKKWIWTQSPYPPNTDVNYYSRDNLLKSGFVVPAEYDYGEIAGDFLGSGNLLTIVSPKVWNIFKKFDGVQRYKIKPYGFTAPFEYIGVVSNGKEHRLNPVKSKVEYFDTGGMSDWDGIFFDDWNGDDIIYIKEFPKMFVVSEIVVNELKEANTTNCRYTPLKDCRCGKYFKKCKPGENTY